MKIGKIGAGRVGTTLGRKWQDKKHEVFFGVRNPDDSKYKWLQEEGFQIGSVADAAQFGEVVVLATPWRATQAAIESAGDLTGKIVIDCVNPLADLSGLEVGHTTSGAEKIAEWAKGAKVFKAFNHAGTEIMANPAFGSNRAVMFVCGDDEDGKTKVLQLISDVGFEAMDAGPLSSARLLEPLAMLWIRLAYTTLLGRDFAFGLLRRE